MKQITDADFQSEVREAEIPVLLTFTGKTCQPCKRLKPVLDELEKGEGGIKFLNIDIEDALETARILNIRAVPSMILFSKGMIMDVKTGFHQKADIRNWIHNNIG